MDDAKTADALADRAAIVQITHDYCWALDDRDWQALHRVFTPDVVADLGAGGQLGVDGVIDRVSSVLNALDASQHLVSTHQITIDGDYAVGRCNLLAQHVRRSAEGGPNFLVGARYEDRYVRTPEGWRISHRRLVILWSEGNRAVVRRAKG